MNFILPGNSSVCLEDILVSPLHSAGRHIWAFLDVRLSSGSGGYGFAGSSCGSSHPSSHGLVREEADIAQRARHPSVMSMWVGNSTEFSPCAAWTGELKLPLCLYLWAWICQEDTQDQRKPDEADFLSAPHHHRIMFRCKVLTLKYALHTYICTYIHNIYALHI